MNLICETLWTGAGSGLLISMLEKLSLFDLTINTGAIDVIMAGSVPEEKSSFNMLRLTFSSKLDWGFYIISKTLQESWSLDLFYEVSFS